MSEITIKDRFVKVFNLAWGTATVENIINSYLSTYDIDRMIMCGNYLTVTFVMRK